MSGHLYVVCCHSEGEADELCRIWGEKGFIWYGNRENIATKTMWGVPSKNNIVYWVDQSERSGVVEVVFSNENYLNENPDEATKYEFAGNFSDYCKEYGIQTDLVSELEIEVEEFL